MATKKKTETLDLGEFEGVSVTGIPIIITDSVTSTEAVLT